VTVSFELLNYFVNICQSSEILFHFQYVCSEWLRVILWALKLNLFNYNGKGNLRYAHEDPLSRFSSGLGVRTPCQRFALVTTLTRSGVNAY
jgi:hypothetical protein